MEQKNVMMEILQMEMAEAQVVLLKLIIIVQEVMNQTQIHENMFLHLQTLKILLVLVIALMNLGRNIAQPRNHHSLGLLHL